MRAERISEIIRLASTLSVALPLIFYLARVRYASRPVHLIGALTIVSALSDLISYIFFTRGQSTVILFNIYYTVLFLLLTAFYYEILLMKRSKATVLSGLVIYMLSFVLVTTYVQTFFEYQTSMWTITGLIMIIYSVSYFFSLFSARTTMTNYGLLWINSGILFYFSFNLSLFVMSSYVLTKLEPQISMLIWSFHNVNNIVKNILLGVGISLYSFKESGIGNAIHRKKTSNHAVVH
jgi:hypothetical protein